MQGERRLRRSLQNLLASKQDKPQIYPGLMGAYVDGVPAVKVSGRADFVWVRLRGVQSEPIMAFNDKVGEHFDLPILVFREPENPHLWRIYGRDVSKYQNWGGASYLPPHGKTHSMSAEEGAGSDIVWVQKPQIMPMLPHPINSGSMSIYIEPEAYYWGGEYHYFVGTGTQSFEPYKPTGATTSRFVTVYIRGEDGSIQYLQGPEYPAAFPPTDIWPYIAVPDADEGFPIGAVNLFSGTTRLGWREIYDLRYIPGPILGTGTSIGIYDEGSPLGQATDFDFVGVGVTAEISGSRVSVSVQGTAQVADEGSILGPAEVLDFSGLGVSVTLSGAYATVSIPGGGGGGGGTGTSTYMLAGLATPVSGEPTGTVWRVPVYPYATGSLSVFINGVNQRPGTDYTETDPTNGEYTLADNPPSGGYHVAIWGVPTAGGGGGGGGELGFFGLDEGVPLGTGSQLDVGYGLDMTRSGTRFRLDAAGPITGSIVLLDEGGAVGSVLALNFVGAYVAATVSGSYGRVAVLPPGVDQIGVYGMDDGVAKGTGTQLNTQYGIQLTVSGTRILLRAEPPITGSVVVSDEGVPKGSVTQLDFVGDAVTVSVSGARAQVAVSATPSLPLSGTVVVYDETTLRGSFPELRFIGAGVDAYNSGSYAAISIEGGGGPGGGGLGVMGWDDGVPVGTGTILEAGDNLTMSLSGTVLRLDATGEVAPTGTILLYDDGDLLGGVQAIDVGGQYAYSARTGSRGFIFGNYISDQIPFSSGSPLDINFELEQGWPDPRWTVSGSTAPNLPPYDVDASWPSHLHTTLSGTQDMRIWTTEPMGYFAPQSGSASLTACFITSLGHVSADGVQVEVSNQLAGASNNSIRALYLRAGTDNPEHRVDKTVAGSNTFNIGLRNVGFHTRVYLHLERIGTGSWGAAMSQDGLGWVPINTLHSQYFSDLQYLCVRFFKADSLNAARYPFGIDWVRVNHRFLWSAG